MDNLPPDHFAVFKAITKYSAVDKKKLYNILGILPKPQRHPSKVRSSGPIECQICDLKTFRDILRYDKLAGGDLLKKNLSKRGIPQGSPISDLLANAVMIGFDKKCFEFCERHGGYYRRYSDDIVFVIPRSNDLVAEVQFIVQEWLKEISPYLEISQKKTRIHEFFVHDGKKVMVSKTTHRCPFEYLGFQFDGKHALFRSSTLSSLSRRIKTTAHAIAHSISKRYKDKPVDELLTKIDVSRFLQRFFRIINFCNKKSYTDQSFWSYARLAERRMGLLGGRLLKQIAGLKKTAVQALENRLREIRSSPAVTIPAAHPPPAAALAG